MKKLCFNYVGLKHRAAEYHSKRTFQACKGKHLLLLCKQSNTMIVSNEGSVRYPVVLV